MNWPSKNAMRQRRSNYNHIPASLFIFKQNGFRHDEGMQTKGNENENRTVASEHLPWTFQVWQFFTPFLSWRKKKELKFRLVIQYAETSFVGDNCSSLLDLSSSLSFWEMLASNWGSVLLLFYLKWLDFLFSSSFLSGRECCLSKWHRFWFYRSEFPLF